MGSKKPYIAAVVVQLTFAGMNLMSKAAFTSGMSSYVFFFYRQAAGTILLIPLTIFFQMEGQDGHTAGVATKSLRDFWNRSHRAYGVAIDYTSATFGAAASNCIPVTTFFFALLFRMEEVKIRTGGGIAKLVGIVVCTGGVAILTFYKGPYFEPVLTHQFFHHAQTQAPHRPAGSAKTWFLGCFFLALSSICSGIWFVLQARFLKHFPCPLTFVCLQSAMSTIQSLVIAVAIDTHPSQWILCWNITLLSLIYCLGTLQCWVIKHKGPVFHAMTTPLDLVATIIGSQLFLSEGIYLGSILGTLLLVTSLYSVLWGKSKEQITVQDAQSQPSQIQLQA